MGSKKKSSPEKDVLFERSQELMQLIAKYDRVIAQVVHASDHTALQSASLTFSFKTENDPKPMDLYIFWGCMDKTALLQILEDYSDSLLFKRNAYQTEKNNVDAQLLAMGLELPTSPIPV